LGCSLCILGLPVFRAYGFGGVFMFFGWGFFFCSLGSMGVSSGFWIFGVFGFCVCRSLWVFFCGLAGLFLGILLVYLSKKKKYFTKSFQFFLKSFVV